MHASCSNPLAGTDTTLLALSGAGYADSRCFGFASCERRAGAAEGVNVLMERRTKRADGQVPCSALQCPIFSLVETILASPI